MSRFVKLATLGELPVGAAEEVEFEGRVYGLFNVHGEILAIEMNLPASGRTARRWFAGGDDRDLPVAWLAIRHQDRKDTTRAEDQASGFRGEDRRTGCARRRSLRSAARRIRPARGPQDSLAFAWPLYRRFQPLSTSIVVTVFRDSIPPISQFRSVGPGRALEPVDSRPRGRAPAPSARTGQPCFRYGLLRSGRADRGRARRPDSRLCPRGIRARPPGRVHGPVLLRPDAGDNRHARRRSWRRRPGAGTQTDPRGRKLLALTRGEGSLRRRAIPVESLLLGSLRRRRGLGCPVLPLGFFPDLDGDGLRAGQHDGVSRVRSRQPGTTRCASRADSPPDPARDRGRRITEQLVGEPVLELRFISPVFVCWPDPTEPSWPGPPPGT